MDDKTDNPQDWAYLLQKLLAHGHTAPADYSIAQAKTYLAAIGRQEHEAMKRIAIAVRVGGNAEPEQFDDFLQT